VAEAFFLQGDVKRAKQRSTTGRKVAPKDYNDHRLKLVEILIREKELNALAGFRRGAGGWI